MGIMSPIIYDISYVDELCVVLMFLLTFTTDVT